MRHFHVKVCIRANFVSYETGYKAVRAGECHCLNSCEPFSCRAVC